jgi:hypothetical protein
MHQIHGRGAAKAINKPEVINLSTGFGTIHPTILTAQGRDLNHISKTSKIGLNRQVIKMPETVAAGG